MSDNSFWEKALRGEQPEGEIVIGYSVPRKAPADTTFFGNYVAKENLIKELASEIELFWFSTGEYSRKDGSRLVWLADTSNREEVKKSLTVLLKNKPSAELLAKHFTDRCEELDDDTREYERAHKLALDLMTYCRGV